MNNEFRSTIDADERQAEFHATYGDDFDAGLTLAYLVAGCGRFLERIVGPERSNAALAEAMKNLANLTATPSECISYLEQYGGDDAFSAWPLGQQFHDLTAYAVFGIVLEYDRSEVDRQKKLEAQVALVKEFFEAAPLDLWGVDSKGRRDLELLVLLATNRWELDNGRPVEPEALAWFGDLAVGSIRNMMSGAKRRFTNEGGKIPANEALAWLAKRPSFWNSIWRDQPSPYYVSFENKPIKSPVFVPVSRDGSIFNPGVSGSGGFKIGPKGKEGVVQGFYEALDELQSMAVPYWRRPNEKGIFCIVKGVRWVRSDYAFLMSIANDQSFRLPPGASATGGAE